MRFHLTAALVNCLIALPVSQAQKVPPPPSLELPESSTGRLVSIRMTYADRQQVAFTEVPAVRADSVFEGEVANLPLGARVWLTVRIGANAARPWTILFPPAPAEESGHWKVRVSLPCPPDNGRTPCEVMAIVSDRVTGRGDVDDEWIRRFAYRHSDPVSVRVLLDDSGPSTPHLEIQRVAELPVGEAQPATVASTFSVEGASRNLETGADIWIAANCASGQAWTLLGHTATTSDGSWRLEQVQLPPLAPRGGRGCALEALSSAAPPPPQPALETDLGRWARARSMAIQLIRDPYYLRVSRITGIDGENLLSRPDGTSETLKLDSAPASMEMESDPMPDDVRIWQLLRCEECRESWLAFGPAQPLASGRYLLVNPRFRFPARPFVAHYVAMVIATRARLDGRALSAAEIARNAVGVSRVLPVEVAPMARPPEAAVSLLSVNGTQINGPLDAPVSLKGVLLDATSKAELPSPAPSVFMGYREPSSGLWIFGRGTRIGDAYRMTAPVEPADRPAGGAANSILVPVLAESLPVERGLEQEWWTEMVVEAGEPAPLRLPVRPWFSRAVRWAKATMRPPVRPADDFESDENGVSSQEEQMNWNGFASLLSALAAIVLAAAAWRRRNGIRVVLNARLDARAARGRAPARSQPYERVIQAWAEVCTSKLRRRTAKRLAAARALLVAAEHQIQSTYEPEYLRLQAKTGRHDASISLAPMSHRILLALLTVGESAFNLAVFYVFREPAVYTILMAMAVAASIPICAFSVGLWVRRWRRPWIATALKFTTTIALLSAALVGLNHVRLAHLSTVAPDFVRQHPELGAAFLSFNALIFLASAMLTYWAHDVEENFAEAKHKIESLQRRAAQLRGAITSLEDRLQSDIARERERAAYYLALYRTVFERHAIRVDVDEHVAAA